MKSETIKKIKIHIAVYRCMVKLSDYIAVAEKVLIALVLASILSVLLVQIALRNIWNTGFFYADIIARQLILWICFLGASLCTYHRRHIKIDLVNRFCPESISRWFRLIVDLFCVVVCILLAKAGYVFVIDEYQTGAMLTGNIPQWIFLVIIPVSLCVMAGRFFLHSIQEILTGDKS
ncbi:MAG: TRAP transporter small permease [Candidatus Auribacterota bacterium]|jgi:C4-dicarboxylate transporter DctQ subunit|nr:TRAP transporter small permease [Candidatus Auribacterota bacterium]